MKKSLVGFIFSFFLGVFITIFTPYSPFKNWEWWLLDISLLSLGFYIMYKIDKIKKGL